MIKKWVILILSLIFVCLSVQSANATRWVDLWPQEDGGQLSVDVDSIIKNPNGYEEAWFKTTEPNKGYRLIHWGFHKFPKEISFLGTVQYDENGKVKSSYSAPTYLIEWDAVVPGSNGEGMHEIVYLWLNNKK